MNLILRRSKKTCSQSERVQAEDVSDSRDVLHLNYRTIREIKIKQQGEEWAVIAGYMPRSLSNRGICLRRRVKGFATREEAVRHRERLLHALACVSIVENCTVRSMICWVPLKRDECKLSMTDSINQEEIRISPGTLLEARRSEIVRMNLDQLKTALSIVTARIDAAPTDSAGFPVPSRVFERLLYEQSAMEDRIFAMEQTVDC